MHQSLKKYRSLFNVSLEEAINYRAEMFLWSVINGIPILSMIVIWLNVVGPEDNIKGYTQAAFLTYYLSGYIFSELSSAHFDQSTVDSINSGRFSQWLLKPIHLKTSYIIKEVPWRILTLLTLVIPVFILTKLLIPGTLTLPTLAHFGMLAPILVITYLLNSLLNLLVISFGFIFEQARSLTHARWMLSWLFSGSMIPPELMPPVMAQTLHLLPFKFSHYVPVQIYTGNLTHIFPLFLQAGVWMLILTLLVNLLWRHNLRHYTAAGN
jgi:ABC-2 type transport system permease protein